MNLGQAWRLGWFGVQAGVAMALLYGAYRHGMGVSDSAWTARWAQQQAALQTATTKALQTARETERRLQRQIHEVANDATLQQSAADIEAVVLDTTGQRLRDEAALFAIGDRCPGSPATADPGATGTRAAMVLSDLLQRADRRAGELAKAYDAARIAGLACERMYEAARRR
jgi:hypothetical protein